MLTLGAPWLLVLLLLVPLAWWIARRSKVGLAPRHRAVVLGLRAVALTCLIAALTAPAWRGESTKMSVVYALDVSRSVAPQFVEAALDWIDAANRRAQPASSRVVAFADRAQLLDNVDAVRSLQVDGKESDSGINRGATNLERALDVAMLGFDPDAVKRLVLLSDGNATTGDVWREVPRLRAAGVRIYSVPAKARVPEGAWIDSIELPSRLRRKEPLQVKLHIATERGGSARVSLREGARVLAGRTANLRPGMNEVVFETSIDRTGLAELIGEVTMEGVTRSAPARLSRSIWLSAAPKLLYVEGHAASSAYLHDALTAQGIDVVMKSAAELPDSAAGYDDYDAVLLSDVAAQQISIEQMQVLDAWVRNAGGGLLFAAGESTYGEKSAEDKGYSGSVLEKALPVQFKAQEKKKELAMVIAIDRSYSMKGRKINFAKEAARATLDLLEEQHRLAVIAFDSQPYVSVPMQPLKAKRKVEELISRIQASGQTNIYPALQIAFRMLNEQDVKSKHVILLSDGDTTPADFQRLVTRMADAKITVSTVTLAGEDEDEQLMNNIAKWGRGRSYRVVDVETLPQIFIDETHKAVRSNLVENAFRPTVKHKVHALKGLDFANAPELKGYISTKARDTAEMLLVSDTGAPILARWQYGLGRSVAFASDVKNRWAADWLNWDGYGKLWAQLVRDTMRRGAGDELTLDVFRDGSSAVVTLSVAAGDGKFNEALTPRVRVRSGAAAARDVELQPIAPGIYQARTVIAPTPLPIRVDLQTTKGISDAALARLGPRFLDYGQLDEFRYQPPNVELLKALSRETGGRYAPQAEQVFEAHGDRVGQRTEMWPWLAVAALLFYLLEILFRRAPFAWRWLGS
jgi:Ca-activated chloride channel homolog